MWLTYRERIIKNFEYQVRKAHREGWDFVDITAEDGYKILALLIEKESIVRCMDCKHRDPEDGRCDCGNGIIWNLPRLDDWFCADGKRR